MYCWLIRQNENFNLLSFKRNGSEEGPSPRTFDANTVITINIILFKLKHAEGISNMWLHCSLIQAEGEIVTVSHNIILSEVESETE